MSCAGHAMKDIAQLRASLEAERLRAERAEGKLEGFREAFVLVLSGRLPTPAHAPVQEPVAAVASAPEPHLTEVPGERDGQRDGVTASVTAEAQQERRREKSRERSAAYRLRHRSVTSVTASVTSVTPNVTQEEEEREEVLLPPPPSRVTPSVTSVTAVRGHLTVVATAAREARERPPLAPPRLPPEVQALREAWDSLCGVQGFTPWPARTSRQLLTDAQAALGRRPLEEWRRVFALVPRSAVCRGELSSRRRASLLWLLTGKCRDGYEPAEKLLSGAWQLDAEPEAEPPAPEATAPPGEDTPAARAWSEVLASLRADGRGYALQQLERLRAREVHEGVLLLEAGDGFFAQWAEHHYGELLTRCVALLGLTGVRFCLPEAVRP